MALWGVKAGTKGRKWPNCVAIMIIISNIGIARGKGLFLGRSEKAGKGARMWWWYSKN